MRRNKYKNSKTYEKGIKFDSKKEAERYLFLLDQQRMGKIRDLVLQERFDFKINGKLIFYYKADFSYIIADTGKKVVEDVKSPYTAKLPMFKLKKKILLADQGVDIQVVTNVCG
jgi:hypothetical protein